MARHAFLYLSALVALALNADRASGEPLVALTTGNEMLVVDTDAPNTEIASVSVSGLQSGENIVGIDFRPATGALFALGSSSRLYTIDLNTGVAAQVGTGQFTTLLDGANFGFDFNPVVDRIRVVSDTEQNLRLHPDTGAVVAEDTALAYDGTDPNSGADPSIVASAYTNSFSGATTTTLFGIDSTLDALVIQGGVAGTPSPNGGALFTEGSLALASSAEIGFDISALTGTPLVALQSEADNTSRLYTISFGTGLPMSQIGTIGSGAAVRDISSPPLDTAAPAVTIETPGTSTVRTRRGTRAFSGTSTDNLLVSDVQFRVVRPNGRTRQFQSVDDPLNWSFTARGLRVGRNQVQVKAVDLFGNESELATVVVNRVR